MTIALDARHAHLKTGTGRVAYNLIKNILQIDRENTYKLLCYEKDPLEDVTYSNVSKLFYQRQWNAKGKQRVIWEYFYLPKLLRSEKVDIFFSPENFMSVPLWKGKQIITIHDLIPIIFPKYYLNSFRRLRFNAKVRGALKHYSKIVTVSQCSKNDIITHFKIKPEKIEIITEAAENPEVTDLEAGKLILMQGVRNKYILALGGLEKRKNNSQLIKAYSRLPSHVMNKYDLVIIGKTKDKSVLYSKFPLMTAKVMGRIHFLESVDDITLGAFYKNASLFVSVSTYEGFGLPILEAMKSGVPVICSNLSSLPEVGGDAVLKVNIEKTWNITSAIIKLLDDDEKKENMIASGYAQAEKYKWEQSAKSLINIFKSINYEGSSST